jgi:hypothetical protein
MGLFPGTGRSPPINQTITNAFQLLTVKTGHERDAAGIDNRPGRIVRKLVGWRAEGEDGNLNQETQGKNHLDLESREGVKA